MKKTPIINPEALYYETSEGDFGLNFPTGISARQLLSALKRARTKLN